MPTQHLPIGGSTFKRTMMCPGWVKASEKIPPRPAGAAAIEGSMHHAVMEECFLNDTTPEDNLGLTYSEDGVSREFTMDDLPLSQLAFDTTNKILDDLDIDEYLIEPFVQLIPGVAGGSIDMLGTSTDRKTVLVLDYKFGKYYVSAEENDQQLFYALAAARDEQTRGFFKEAERVVLVILQPQSKTGFSQYEYSIRYLDNYRARAQAAIDTARSDEAPRSAGEHCKWCPAQPYCPTARTHAVASKMLDSASHNELVAGMAEVEAVEAWCASIKEEAYLQMTKGVPVPGWKIVEKQASRKWIDEDGAIAALAKKRVPKKLYSPARILTAPQTLAMLQKNKINLDLSPFIKSTSSGTTLAPDSDKRDAVLASDVPDTLADLMSKSGGGLKP
jgi:hypothetical protein